MQILDSLKLPDELPTEEALRSWGQNIHDYEPEFWELQYDNYRYLKNINHEQLFERYRNIRRNFLVLTGKIRNVIPINSFLSSWYWYKKEHQTRYEFFLRNLPMQVPPPQPRDTIPIKYRTKGPNSCNILFRYGHFSS